MTDFERSLRFVLNNEGGYTNIDEDKGGKTNLGITQSTLNRARQKVDGLPETVKELTRSQAQSVYETLYWYPSKCEKMEYPLCCIHFDASVNHGLGGGGRLLQRAINSVIATKIAVDGVVGSETLTGLQAAMSKENGLRRLCTAHCDKREDYYYAIVQNDSTQEKFLKGWLNRNNRCRALISAELHTFRE